jgi:acetolactate synthase-1/2/3 large subunit
VSNKYSDQFMDWLKEDGYTHCFFVGGGNVMHLLEAASRRFNCVAVVHEVAAGIAAEYFNETNQNGERAFALVTAGPGLTNIVTALGGAFLESRELLVVGGQAKTTDLARGTVPQIGHQEIDGIGIVKPITVASVMADRRLDKSEVLRLTHRSREGRKGPVFIEMCLDVSAMPPLEKQIREVPIKVRPTGPSKVDMKTVQDLWLKAKRPMLLLGGGVDKSSGLNVIEKLMGLKIPMATTWNGFDRVPYEYSEYCGRPNTYGMRWANILVQSADLVLAVGTRLGIQQIGFAWDEFVGNGKIVQVDLDRNELQKGFPKLELGIQADAVEFLEAFIENLNPPTCQDWKEFISEVRFLLDKPDEANIASEGFIELHSFIRSLGDVCDSNDVIVPCSSGGTFNAVMQMFRHKVGQSVTTDKGLASMGYGLSGAIGASIANPDRRVILMEGDGGFAQNLQELGTVSVNKLNLKIFLTSNKGYASIRTTQKSYFNGNYVGCDLETGLGLPNWEKIFEAYEIPVFRFTSENLDFELIKSKISETGPQGFIIDLDPEQLFYPKVTSRVLDSGAMKTNPIHLMSPDLDDEDSKKFLKYIK